MAPPGHPRPPMLANHKPFLCLDASNAPQCHACTNSSILQHMRACAHACALPLATPGHPRPPTATHALPLATAHHPQPTPRHPTAQNFSHAQQIASFCMHALRLSALSHWRPIARPWPPPATPGHPWPHTATIHRLPRPVQNSTQPSSSGHPTSRDADGHISDGEQRPCACGH